MNKTIRKVVGVLVLVMAIITTQIPAKNARADSTDFKMNGNILVKYLGTEKSVSIPNKVKKIGPDAFSENTSIEEITIKGNVDSIGYNAFANCNNLEKIEISDSIKAISSAAFNNCTKLNEVTIGSGLKELGSGVFAGCESLEKISISKDNDNFLCSNGIIYNHNMTKVYQMLPGRKANVYDMPDSIIKIEEYAFWGCNNLQTLQVSDNLKEVPAYSFSNCMGLKAIDIPFSISRIEMKAFEDCVNLEKVVIPMSINFIHETAFDGCNKLEIVADAGTIADKFAQRRDITKVSRTEYEDIIETIMENAIPEEKEDTVKDHNISENSISGNYQTIQDYNKLVDGMETVEDASVIGKTKIIGNHALVFIDNSNTNVINGNSPKNGVTNQNDDEIGIIIETKSPLFAGSQKGIYFPKYTLVDGTKIANQAYYLDGGLNEFQIPKGVITIGDFAFARSNLSSITIPEGVTKIGYGAFYHCDNLMSVLIPHSVVEMEPSAFVNTKWMEQWKASSNNSDYLVVGDGILLAYKGTSNRLTIPEGVNQIAPEVFMDHLGILSVSFPDSLKVIGEDAFSGCKNLKTITGGINITTIKDRAFDGCAIDGIRVSANVSQIGLKAYDLAGVKLDLTKTYAVFQGKELPTVTYEDTAARFSNKEDRTLALNNVNLSVINSSISTEECKNTILDPSFYGFRGLVVSIITEGDNLKQGTVQLKLCTLIPDEKSGVISIPASVTIYGREYLIADSDENAFYYYQGEYRCFPNYLKEIELPQILKAQEKSLLNGIEFSNVSGKKETISSPNGTLDQFIEVHVDSKVFPESSMISAHIIGNTDHYILKIREITEENKQISKAYMETYSNGISENIVPFDLTLFDSTETIKINKLGRNKMSIMMPVPSAMNSNGVRVMCLDEDGQLEAVSSQLMNQDGIHYVKFYVSHFSQYAIYDLNRTSVLAQTGTLDYSPDTGDPISPKWFLSIGLFCFSIVLFMWKDKRVTRKIKTA